MNKIFTAHQRASDTLNRGFTKDAAKILCAELRRILTLQSFWQDVQSAMPSINKNAESGRLLLRNLNQLIEDETRAIDKLRIGNKAAAGVLKDVFAGISIADMALGSGANTTAKSLQDLERDLRLATELICKATKGKLATLRDAIMTKKGLLALAGIGIISADVLIFTQDGGVFSWTSVKLGHAVASGNTKDVIDILSGWS